jgi:hypothetical protein
MKGLMGVFGGVGILIGIYLFVYNGDRTVQIINALANPAITSIKTLQGR